MVGKTLFKDMSKYFFIAVIPAIVRFTFIPLVSRLFPPAIYGNYVIVITTVSVLLSFVSFMPIITVRFFPAFEKDNRLEALISNLIKFLLICIAVMSLITAVSLFIAKPFVPPVICKLMFLGLVMFVLKANTDLFISFFRAGRESTKYTIFSIWDSATPLCFGIALVIFFNFGISGLLWGAIIAVAIPFPFLLFTNIRKGLLRHKISCSIIKEFTRYGLPIAIQTILFSIIVLSDRYILSYFHGSAQVGIYSISSVIATMGIMSLTSPFRLADRPIAMHTWEKEGEHKAKECVSRLTKYYFMICLPAVIGLSILAKPIIFSLVAENYRLGYRVIPFVAFAYFFLGISDRFQLGIEFYKKSHLFMYCTMFAALVNVALNILTIPRYGYLAAGINILITYIIYMILIIVVSRRFFIWDFSFMSLGRIALSSAIMGVVLYFISRYLSSFMVLNIAVSICVGIVIYTSMLFLLREIGRDEVKIFKEWLSF